MSLKSIEKSPLTQQEIAKRIAELKELRDKKKLHINFIKTTPYYVLNNCLGKKAGDLKTAARKFSAFCAELSDLYKLKKYLHLLKDGQYIKTRNTITKTRGGLKRALI